jgi:hypothetical protein
MTAFLQAIGSVVVGSYTSARLNMSVPAELDLVDALATWELLDQQGRVWTFGEAASLTAENSQVAVGQKTISAESEVAVPSNLPVNEAGTTYQIRWTVRLRSNQPLYAFENFTVLPSTEPIQGALDALEMFGDDAEVYIRLPAQYSNVEYECYRGNTKLFNARATSAPAQEADGYVYKGTVHLHEYTSPSLDPFTIVWSYWNGTNGVKQRETTQLFIVNPVVLDAVKEMQNWLNRAYTDSGRQPSTSFSPTDFVKYLRTGRDHFNAADKPTEFTMLGAAGPIRWFWIGYSCVSAARAQYLAEGMKAFNYSGQVVQLDIDNTQFWDATAQALEGQLAEQVKPFKDNLVKRGILGGDGSSMALRRGAVGSIGVTIHGMSPVRGLYGLGSPLSPYTR